MLDKSVIMTYNINTVILIDWLKGVDKLNIKELRIAKGMTQEQLANECGVQRTTITMIELGENKPSVELAKKLVLSLKLTGKVSLNNAVKRFGGCKTAEGKP